MAAPSSVVPCPWSFFASCFPLMFVLVVLFCPYAFLGLCLALPHSLYFPVLQVLILPLKSLLFQSALCTILGFHSVSLFSCSNASSSFYSFLVTSLCILSLENIDSKSLFLTISPPHQFASTLPKAAAHLGGRCRAE